MKVHLRIKPPGFLTALIREFKSRIGLNQDYLTPDSSLINQWRNIKKNAQLGTGEKEQKILFITGYGLGAHYLTIEPIIAAALKARGHEVHSLICDAAVPACELNIDGNSHPAADYIYRAGVTQSTTQRKCRACSENAKTVYPVIGIEQHSLKEFISSEEYAEAGRLASGVTVRGLRGYEYQGLNVGEQAYASILRATFRGEVEDSSSGEALARRYVMSGILTVIGYKNIIKKIGADKIVCIHGVYQTHGLAVSVANAENVPVVVMGGGGIRKDTVVVCHNETYHHQLVTEPRNIWLERELNEYERKRVLEYAEQKRTNGQGVDYLSYHPNPITSLDYLRDNFGILADRKIVSLYTNVIWDAQVVYSSNVFDDIFDWLWTSIDLLGRNENVWVIIRIHPAEAKGGVPTKQPMLPEIQKRFPSLPDNVRIIAPEDDFCSYVLAENSHLNIIYGTKMGLEIALMRKPLVICGETFSRNKGYGVDIKSKDQYAALLSQAHSFEQDTDATFEIALKYAHYFYFRRMLDLPITTTSSGQKKLRFSELSELTDEKYRGLQKVCDGIINGSAFHLE